MLAIAPASGHAYAGDWSSAIVTTGLRGAIVGLVALRPDLIQAPCLSSFCENDYRPHADFTGALALAFAATVAYDIYDAGRAAHRANLEGIQLQPLMTPILEPASTSRVAGLSLRGSF